MTQQSFPFDPENLPTTTTYSSKEDKIKEELTRLTTASISAFNDKDFTYSRTPSRRDFLSRISPNFTASIERVNHTLNWEGLGNIWQHLATTMPECRFEVVNVSVDIIGYNRASVFMETSTRVQEGVVWNRIMEYKWYLTEGVWMHSGITSISGSQGNSGMVV